MGLQQSGQLPSLCKHHEEEVCVSTVLVWFCLLPLEIAPLRDPLQTSVKRTKDSPSLFTLPPMQVPLPVCSVGNLA